MKTILFILEKEFKQIIRDKRVIALSIFAPIIQMLILVYAASFEFKNIKITIVDQDMSETSRLISQKFIASPFFIVSSGISLPAAREKMQKGKTDMIMVIPFNFEATLLRDQKANISLIIDAVNQTKASIANAYVQSIVRQFNAHILAHYITPTPGKTIKKPRNINILPRFWYNPHLDYKSFMIPGILAILITSIGMFLASMNIVKEKELGTIEQINVTPVHKTHFIIGKLLPFWLLGIFDLAFGLGLGKLIFRLPFIGSPWTLFLAAGIFLFLVLSLGLLLSTITDTQQQAMFMAWFFMIIFILMSGLFTAIESMPRWAQLIDYLNPLSYFIRIMRMVLLKGSTLADIKFDMIAMAVYGTVVYTLAVFMYRKVSK